MELTFNLTMNGQSIQIPCSDTIFSYVAYRQVLPEEICLGLLNEIKKQSGKKIAIIWGNCQTERLHQFFIRNATFCEKYLILRIPAVYEYYTEEKINLFQENFWSLCDLFISQRVSKDNRFSSKIATQNLPARLPEDTKIIWIPNIYFDGYFPQYKNNLRNADTQIHKAGRFPHGDKYIDKFMNIPGGGFR